MIWQKLLQMLSIIVVVITLSAPLSFAGSEYIYGKVKSVDTKTGKVVIMTDDDETKTITLPEKMLKGVKPGHEVDVEMTDGKVTGVENYSADS